jgi:hypothetical protein
MTDRTGQREGESREQKPRKRKAYEKPAFRHERVFETMALSCGKVHPTQGQCRFNRKSS